MDEALRKIRSELRIRPAKVKRRLMEFIKGKVEGARASGVVLGLSGGVDSTVIAHLCASALGSENVLGISMPDAGVTDPQDVADAREVANMLGIEFKVVNLAPPVKELRRSLGALDANADKSIPVANIKPRVRMTVLYYFANSLNRLVVGASNRSEIRAGYFTKYGDGGSDLAPLGCLYKVQVMSLARYLGIPDRILQKPPSAGLWPGQVDEVELGLPYQKLDMIYAGLDLGLDENEIAEAVGVKVEDIRRFKEREEKTKHKLVGPEIPDPELVLSRGSRGRKD